MNLKSAFTGDDPKFFCSPTEAEKLKYLKRTLKKISQATIAAPFRYPVDTSANGYPDYLDIINKPMDFNTIISRIPEFEAWRKADTTAVVKPDYLPIYDQLYRDSYALLRDIHLIWDNCYVYNGKDSQIGKDAQKLQNDLKKQMEETIDKCWWGPEQFHEVGVSTDADLKAAMTPAERLKPNPSVPSKQDDSLRPPQPDYSPPPLPIKSTPLSSKPLPPKTVTMKVVTPKSSPPLKSQPPRKISPQPLPLASMALDRKQQRKPPPQRPIKLPTKFHKISEKDKQWMLEKANALSFEQSADLEKEIIKMKPGDDRHYQRSEEVVYYFDEFNDEQLHLLQRRMQKLIGISDH
ncbi:hypothetical protein BLNAU_71 [Blattamonas nauphoetae]|uniref:Bromo domain-containing protein n=1 Tax=Blattamonas nauphoetae TaxID=2049346 RepID=A0ABQ9YLY6_9EUKA|nr:hypothetical protein BLNAU_71 [Blattamonas nauphoetae]